MSLLWIFRILIKDHPSSKMAYSVNAIERLKRTTSIGRMLFPLVLVVVIGGLVACVPNSGTEDDTETAAVRSGRVVIYSGRKESLVQPIIDQFQQESGIEVEVRYGNTSELAGVLLEEGEGSPADVFYAQDPGGLGAVQKAGLLAELPEEILNKVPDRFSSDQGEWVGISGRARTVVYNTNAIENPETELPENLEGFADPTWAGRLGWAPTNGSFQAMMTGMRAIWGDEKTQEWLQAIQANQPIAYQSNSAIVAATGAGEIDAGFVNHYYLYRFIAEEGEDFAARNYFLPGGGPGSLIMVSGAGLLQSAENPDNGLRFIEFLLSGAGQQYFSDQTFEYPLVDGVITAVDLPPLEELDKQAVEIDLTEMADLEGTQDMLLELGIID